jgi:hypothetical protein
MGVTIFRGLHSSLRPQAARLYWEAFGGKLGRVLGPDERALRFFQRVIRGDLCFAAVDGDKLVGIAGYKTPAGSFAGGSWDDLTEVYGDLIDEAFLHVPARLDASMPCCGGSTSLNALRFDWPAGFARFVLEARNAGVGKDSWLPTTTSARALLTSGQRRVSANCATR